MKDFYGWMKSSLINESDLNQFNDGVLANVNEATPWLVAADYADEEDIRFENFEVGKLLRSIAILCQYGMDYAEQVAEQSGTPNNPNGRVALMNACRGSIPWFAEWASRRNDLTPFLNHGIVPDEIPDSFPKVNRNWEVNFDVNTQLVNCRNSFYATDQMGGYAGYVDYEVSIICQPNHLDFVININQDQVAEIEADNPPDPDDETGETGVYLGHLEEYLNQEFYYALTNYLHSD